MLERHIQQNACSVVSSRGCPSTRGNCYYSSKDLCLWRKSESLTNLSEEAREKHGEERIAVRNDYDLVHVLVR